MFGSNGKKKNTEFVGKVQAARQQRAEEKEREKAAICIQVTMKFEHLIWWEINKPRYWDFFSADCGLSHDLYIHIYAVTLWTIA